jgi:hypothetical protein
LKKLLFLSHRPCDAHHFTSMVSRQTGVPVSAAAVVAHGGRLWADDHPLMSGSFSIIARSGMAWVSRLSALSGSS